MALQCPEVVKSSNSISSDPAPVEEVKSLKQSCKLSRALSKLKNSEILLNKKHSLSFTSRKPFSSTESRLAGDYLPHGCHSIIDLPPALVSEILHCLGPKDLGIVCCVSTLLQNIASDHRGWKEFYCQRWGLPSTPSPPPGSALPGGKTWKDLFVEREHKSKSFMGRFSLDSLRGHTEDVRAVCFLQSAKLIFSSGFDSIVRMWDMEEGAELAASKPLGCSVRALAVDAELLLAGCTDAFIQCWRRVDRNPHVFDIADSVFHKSLVFRLWGHQGPISCLSLDSARIYSGSWDMSVRIWDRVNFECVTNLSHRDWVWDLAPRGSTIVTSAGRNVYFWDSDSGNLVDAIEDAHVGNTYALARSHLGDLLFTGGESGDIRMFEIAKEKSDSEVKLCATWKPHESSVQSLAFEFPWLVSCSCDGRVALIDVRKLLKSARSLFFDRSSDVVEPPQRMLHGSHNGLYSIAVGADRIVCGGQQGILRVWNFSGALEAEERVRALRRIRVEHRMRRHRVQIEMNQKGGLSDQTSGASKWSQKNVNWNAACHGKKRDQKSRGLSS